MGIKAPTATPSGNAKPNHEVRRTRKPLPILPNLDQFPSEGYSLWRDARPFVRRSREWVRLKEKAGLFPRGVRISANEVMWPNAELKRFLRDPLNYRVEV